MPNNARSYRGDRCELADYNYETPDTYAEEETGLFQHPRNTDLHGTYEPTTHPSVFQLICWHYDSLLVTVEYWDEFCVCAS